MSKAAEKHGPNKGSLAHTALCVSSLSRSEQFYCRLLGLVPAGSWERASDGLRAVVLQDDKGGHLEIVESACAAALTLESAFEKFGMVQTGIRHLAFSVSSVDDSYQLALLLGARPLLSPQPGKSVLRIAFVAGPDGEQIELIQHQ